MQQRRTVRSSSRAVRGVALALAGLLVGGTGGLAPTAASASEPGAQSSRTILLLDASRSMEKSAGDDRTKIEAARQALSTVVADLPEDAEVGLQVFGAQVRGKNDPGACTDSQLVVEPATDNRDDLNSAVDGYAPYGETPIPHALTEAARDLGDTGPRSIILVSDGESTCDPDPCEVAADLAEDGIDLRIDVVGLSVSPQAREQLRCIASAGNGTYFDADDADAVEDTLLRLAKRAVRPFTLDGTPITGGDEGSPTRITEGRWLDAVGTEDLYYAFERTEPGTTLRVSATTQGENSTNDVARVEIRDPQGQRCDIGLANRILDTRTVTGAQATAGPRQECDAVGTYTIGVGRSVAAESTVPMRVLVSEEPAVEDPGFVGTEGADTSFSLPEFGGTPTPVDGAASFVDAPEITAGVWSSDVVPGEAVVYRFRLEYGQSASVGVRFPAGSEAQRRALDGGILGRMTLMNPLMANLGFSDDAVFSEAVGGSEQVDFHTSTGQVSQASGEGFGAFDGNADYTLPGDYYVMVALRKGESVVLPFQIELQVAGSAEAGPTYVDGVEWSLDGGSADAGPDAEAEGTSEEGTGAKPGDKPGDKSGSNSGLATGLVTGLAVGGVLLLSSLVGVWLVLRRGSGRSGR